LQQALAQFQLAIGDLDRDAAPIGGAIIAQTPFRYFRNTVAAGDIGRRFFWRPTSRFLKQAAPPAFSSPDDLVMAMVNLICG